MTAVLLHTGSSSGLAWIAPILLMIPIGLLLAPQPIRRDKRAIVAIVLILLVLGIVARADAAVTGICKYAWYAFECWFY